MKRTKAFSLAVTLSLVTGLAQAGETSTYGKPGLAKNVSQTVRIEARETEYNVNALSVKAGSTVKFVLVNAGKETHELSIGDAAKQAEHRKMMEQSHGGHGGGHGSGHEHHGDSTITAKPGETKELVWQFTTAGRFAFVCNHPGHAELGMSGTIVVE